MLTVIRPFVAYLRVYEPLSAFEKSMASRLKAAIAAARLSRQSVGAHERRMWLISQTVPAQLLPGEQADGQPIPNSELEMLVLDPAEVPGTGVSEKETEFYVCPLELRARSAAALVNFLGDASGPLLDSVLGKEVDAVENARTHMFAALHELSRPAVHVLSATWSVPLPWFTLIDPQQRRLNLGSGRTDPEREVSWRAPISDALNRADEALTLMEETLGDSDPVHVLTETLAWLENFDANSVIELDYGGLVQLIDDELLQEDPSALNVQEILVALQDGQLDDLAELVLNIRDFWHSVAVFEHVN